MYKQVILVRKDLNMPVGKIGAQCGHAAVNAVREASIYNIHEWAKDGDTKVVLGVDSYEELLELVKAAELAEIPFAIILDEGRTVFNGQSTFTVAAIGPDDSKLIDKITGHLKLL